MKANPKLIILILVALAVGAIFVIPYLNNEPPGETQPGEYGQTRQNGRQDGAPDGTPTGAFTTTPNPGAKLKEAMENSRPVFLEFYAVT